MWAEKENEQRPFKLPCKGKELQEATALSSYVNTHGLNEFYRRVKSAVAHVVRTLG